MTHALYLYNEKQILMRGRHIVSKIGIQRELVVLLAAHDPHLLVLAHPLLEAVGLPLQRDVLHEVKGVLQVIHLLTAQLSQKAKRTLNYEAGNEI